MTAVERSNGTCVLVVDDDPDLLKLIAIALEADGCHVVSCGSGTSGLEALAAEPFDVVVTDIVMDGMNGLELCERIAAARPEIPVVVITGSNNVETAVAAIRVGAYDFITKPLNLDAVRIAVSRASERRRLRTEVVELRHANAVGHRFDELIGDSDAMRRTYALLEQFARSEASVLITGESGTGKEVVARALHRRSSRREGAMVSVNCAAMPETLLESELFGHERGAFTDAKTARTGLFVQADGGTLFLDEIGEMPLALQPKLLRALQERCVRPVGGAREISFDARVIVATNRDLETAIEERRFREDLYYRINVLHVDLPPLRARGRDVLQFAQHFVTQFSEAAKKPVRGLTPEVAAKLLAYSWPGNVRELRNSIERAVALSQHTELIIDDLPGKVRAFRPTEFILPSAEPAELLPMEEVERRYVLRVIETLGGNKRQAAKVLGFDRRTLYRKLEKYGVAPDTDAES